MNHGMTNFNAGGKPVDDQPSCLPFENGDEIRICPKIIIRRPERGGQMSL